MISYIKGNLANISENSVSLINGAIGFEIKLPVNKISDKILNEGDEMELFTAMIVRENDISLWGFLNKQSLRMFNLLIDVSGVGPRTAQNIIYEVGVEGVVNAILMREPSKLKVSGVGAKTAEKIILELRNKIEGKFSDVEIETSANLNINSNLQEAVDALITLGYKEKDILSVIKNIEMSESRDTQSIIKTLLKHL